MALNYTGSNYHGANYYASRYYGIRSAIGVLAGVATLAFTTVGSLITPDLTRRVCMKGNFDDHNTLIARLKLVK